MLTGTDVLMTSLAVGITVLGWGLSYAVAKTLILQGMGQRAAPWARASLLWTAIGTGMGWLMILMAPKQTIQPGVVPTLVAVSPLIGIGWASTWAYYVHGEIRRRNRR